MQDINDSSLRRLEMESVFLKPLRSNWKPIPFSEENFTAISSKTADKTLIFIDGGNAEIVKTADYSLQFIRITAVWFNGREKVFQRRKEGYVLVKSQLIDNKMCFATHCYGGLTGSEELCVSADDLNRDEVPIMQIGNIFRALQEIKFAKEVFTDNSVIVLDRSLIPENEYEEKAFKDLKGIVCGLNKTTSLLCNNGESVVSVLQSYGRRGCWVYNNVFSNYNMDFVKLHSKSKYLFRFEINNNDGLQDVASWLCSLSNDAVFLGYPYGLIVADSFARVSNREKEYLQTMFSALSGKEFAVEALNAHSVLDNIG
ncbi:hypothetical protein COV16_02765 [Candidatus Woesearchaeota archaeon CG10_big_fil_rev_8_21_14_0_10_34_8]|nr:MAG: hypothetical protein COV16_02765 [Candidatus Woesearchaeota archaeon CG10_big_fil_rev_8_21_14_0_10_34_8]